jgi:uncharacterized protein DUF4112
VVRVTEQVGYQLLVGAIPFVGDVFYVFWKANRLPAVKNATGVPDAAASEITRIALLIYKSN